MGAAQAADFTKGRIQVFAMRRGWTAGGRSLLAGQRGRAGLRSAQLPDVMPWLSCREDSAGKPGTHRGEAVKPGAALASDCRGYEE